MKVPKGTNPLVLSVSWGRKRRNWPDKRMGGMRHQRELEWLMSNLGNNYGIIQRRLMLIQGMYQTMKQRSRIGPHRWKGPRERHPKNDKGEYNRFTILTFFCYTISPFSHFTMRTWVYYLHQFTIFVSPYICFTPSHHFTFSPLFRNFIAKRNKKNSTRTASHWIIWIGCKW